ncbi:hypothetical protein ISS30_01915 [bacterium]|nr:hypothetical protein [bacterium]
MFFPFGEWRPQGPLLHHRIFEWRHASLHDTKVLYLLCMVSTAESRHHIELNPKPQPLNPIFKVKA